MSLQRCSKCGAEVQVRRGPDKTPRAYQARLVWARVDPDLVPTADQLWGPEGVLLGAWFPREAVMGGPRWAWATKDGRQLEVLRGGCRAQLLHAPRCPAEQRRRKAHQLAEHEGRPPSAWDHGWCDRRRGGCGRPILWGRTEAGKAVPLDPEPQQGVELDTAEARQLRGQPELVRGFDRHGKALAVKLEAPGAQLGLLDEAKPKVWVWVTHWATCPNADVLRERP